MPNYRNKSLLEATRRIACQSCGAEDGTVCAAHSNQIRDGKGKSIKSHDYRIAALCFACHYDIDQGKDLNKAEKIQRWEDAHRKTIGKLFELGFLEVKV
jgi:hypothetical protein